MEQRLPVDRVQLAAKLGKDYPFFDYQLEIRKVIYMANAIESINMSMRKVIKMY